MEIGEPETAQEPTAPTDTPSPHSRKGDFIKVGENLYRYSSSKRYYAVFRIKGKLIWKSLKTTDKEIAKRKLKDEMEAQGRVDPVAGKLTLQTLLDLYEKSIQQYDDKTQRTRASILRTFKKTWKSDMGLAVPLRDITSTQVDLWLAPHRKRLRKATFNEYLRFLRQLFAIALKANAIARSPVQDLKELKRERPIRTTPTWDEFRALVASVRSQQFSAEAEDTADLLEFMGLAGVGIAECANLHGEHIDFKAGRMILYRRKTETGYTVPIFPQILPFLERLKQRGQIQNGHPLFKVKDPKKALASACKRLALPAYSSRALRRCFITRAIEKGVDFKTLAAWQGHSDGGVLIAKTYSHLRNEHSDAMAKRLVAAE